MALLEFQWPKWLGQASRSINFSIKLLFKAVREGPKMLGRLCCPRCGPVVVLPQPVSRSWSQTFRDRFHRLFSVPYPREVITIRSIQQEANLAPFEIQNATRQRVNILDLVRTLKIRFLFFNYRIVMKGNFLEIKILAGISAFVSLTASQDFRRIKLTDNSVPTH